MLENVKFNLERFLVSVCREKYLCQLFFLSGSKNRLRKYPYSFSHTGNGPTCFAAALPSRPVCNHLHARNSTKVNLSHHQLLLPWEPKQRSPSLSCTEAFSHFLTCLQFKQSLAGAAEKGSRQHPALITELSLTHTHTQTDTVCSPSLHSHCAEVQDRLCANTLHMLRVRQPCLQSWALTMLRWGQVISASHVTHQSLLLSWCHCESMGTLITLFLHSTWNSLKEVVVFCVLTLKKLTNCGN